MCFLKVHRTEILKYDTMANIYTQCYFHLVFAVRNRDALIKKNGRALAGYCRTKVLYSEAVKPLAKEAV
jgi:hypothetical protein